MSLIDDPKFWFGFLGLEVGLPLLIPNKRWAGALMVASGVLLIGSAVFGESIGASSTYIKSHLSLFAISGAAVLLVGVVAGIERILRRDQAPNIRELNSSNQIQPVWPSLERSQIVTLRNRLATLPSTIEKKNNRIIAMVRSDFPDCVHLADDIAQAFRDSGWELVDDAPAGTLFCGRIPDGIYVAGPMTDPRRTPLAAVLREVLGSQYEPIRLDTRLSMQGPDGAVVIRLCIGRKPRK
jgi:hypothetical protein